MTVRNTVDNDVYKPRLVSIKSAAELLGVHPNTVRKHLQLVKIGDRALVRLEDIDSKIGKGQNRVGV